MSLILSKLENVMRGIDGKLVARCPACAAAGDDTKGNHLVIYPDGRFACVVYPGTTTEAVAHRKKIYRLAGDGASGTRAKRARRMLTPLVMTFKRWQENYR